MSTTTHDHEISRWLRGRLWIDRGVAVVLALLTAPFVAILAVLVRRDGHPALIQVPRVGRGGEVFAMWKLRSMRVETEDGLAGGPPLTGTRDYRITPIGRRLRAFHADEVPQLYNVVLGEMALLGPRPEAPEFVDAKDDQWQHVLRVPPGIAGPTQLLVGDWESDLITASPDGSAYVEVVVPVKVATDNWYVRRASPLLDALVIFGLMQRLAGTESVTLLRRIRDEVPQVSAALE